MNILYTNIEEFKKSHGDDFLKPYIDIEIKTKKRFYEYGIGRYLAKYGAEKFYNVSNPEIVINKNGKPIFKNCDLNFSISHSRNLVVVCIDKAPCGIDVEYIEERDLKKFSKHFNREFKNLDDFYEFWTKREAQYKLNKSVFDERSFKINNYYLTVVSESKINNVSEVSLI